MIFVLLVWIAILIMLPGAIADLLACRARCRDMVERIEEDCRRLEEMARS